MCGGERENLREVRWEEGDDSQVKWRQMDAKRKVEKRTTDCINRSFPPQHQVYSSAPQYYYWPSNVSLSLRTLWFSLCARARAHTRVILWHLVMLQLQAWLVICVCPGFSTSRMFTYCSTGTQQQFSSFKLQNCCGKVWDYINWIMMKTICIVNVLTSVAAAAASCFANSRQTFGSIKAGESRVFRCK